jgi:7,8-dihydroneopterin aldolase/epimerase/oxygenase
VTTAQVRLRGQTRLDGEILLRGLAARCVIGVRPWERRRRQRVVLDVALTADLGAAASTDDLAQALDYKVLKDDILAHVRTSSFRLLEALAASVADLVLADPRVRAVDVTVDKPGALTGARSIAVRIRRTAPG